MTLSQRIGRFHVTRPLGSGTFSTVWLARDDELDGWVAIKILAENWSYNQDARRRFTEEARALRRIDSDRIVGVYDVGRLDDGRPYMVMEYADEGSLGDRMRLRGQLGRPFEIDEAVRIAVDVAGCLVSVHALRIVHRDIKPTNVLFKSVPEEVQDAMRRSGRPVDAERMLLGDFGVARRLELSGGQTMVVGSPQYMAPEQADPATAGDVDDRSDVYSATVILYELLAGRVPFPFDSADHVRAAQQGPGPPSIRDLRPDLSPALSAVIDRGIARDPRDRFASAWEWRDALRDASATPTRSLSGVVVDEPDREPPPEPTRLGIELPTGVVPAPDGTDVLADLAPPVVAPSPARRIGLVDCSVLSAAAAVAIAVSTLLPWRASPSGVPYRAVGVDFGLAPIAAAVGAAMLLPALLRWLVRRRWTIAFVRVISLLAGLIVVGLAIGQGVLIQGDVHSLARRGIQASIGYGLFVLLGGGVLGLLAAGRARRQFRLTRPSPFEAIDARPVPTG